MAERIRTFKRKFDGTSKAPWDGNLVEENEDWVVVFFEDPPEWNGRPPGTRYAMTFYALEQPVCVLVSLDRDGSVLEYQCDAGLPATRADGEIAFVDLDLDVMANADLSYHVRDHDDFAAHRVSMGYPEDVTVAALEGIETAKSLIEARAYPFDGSPERILAAVLAGQAPG